MRSTFPNERRRAAFLTAVSAASLLWAACATPSGGPSGDPDASVDSDGRIDAGQEDAGHDSGPVGDADGAVDADQHVEETGTCEACTDHPECGPLARCIQLTNGDRACTPTCVPDVPSCPLGFDCVYNFMAPEETVCVPIGESCCLDADADGYGQGIGCRGPDCNESDSNINPGAPERCNGIDDDCDDDVDEEASDCGDADCNDNEDGFFEETEAGLCVDAECVEGRVTACGLYTCGRGADLEDRCATSCHDEGEDDDTLCIPAAHCDAGICEEDLVDGEGCDEDSDCESAHCDNGFCCADGVCCAELDDCPGAGSVTTTCDNSSTCQGSRGEAACTDFQCTTEEGIADDSACDESVEADTCGFFLSIFCTGEADQDVPRCPSLCEEDADCDEGAHCDTVCLPDLTDGSSCDEDSDCMSNHCNNRICCAAGDCCLEPADCPASYSSDPVCDSLATCQGSRDAARCADFQCETQADRPDDSACLASMEADDCGLFPSVFCTGGESQPVPECADSCTSDGQCDDNAHCDLGSCAPDVPDGGGCDEDSDCQSGHCQNGFCCVAGDCCAVGADCPASHGEPSVCDDAATCQGRRRDPVCIGSMCTLGGLVDDDSGCDGLTSNECGFYPAVECSSALSQPADQASLCETSCTGDLDCDPGAHCSGGECVADGDPGDPCLSSTECSSGLQCVDFVCCTSSCTGTCRACDVAGHEGTCWNVGSGDDPDNECDGFGCAGYYWGWYLTDQCWSRADAANSDVACNGAGGCEVQNDVCPSMGRGSRTLTCDSLCQDPRAGTCAGTVAGQCDNVVPSPSTETCGVGECQRTVDRCVDGSPQSCSPGRPVSETCDNRDEDCDGIVDNNVTGVIGTSNEPNDTCATRTNLGTVAEFNGPQSWSRTIYPDSDNNDYYRFYAEEGTHTCFPGSDQDYRIRVTLQPPTGSDCRDYDLQLLSGGCGVISTSNASGCSAETIEYTWDGVCGGNDSRTFHVRVYPYLSVWECRPYTLTIDMWQV